LKNIILQKLIYIWNKTSKHIMSRCGKDFQSIPLHITYNFQHFEPIEYVNSVSKILHVFKTNNPNMIFNLDKFLSCSKSMNNFLHLIHRIKFAILLEWKLDSTFTEILKNHWDSPCWIMLSPYSTFFAYKYY
jgi:hypothetical protein